MKSLVSKSLEMTLGAGAKHASPGTKNVVALPDIMMHLKSAPGRSAPSKGKSLTKTMVDTTAPGGLGGKYGGAHGGGTGGYGSGFKTHAGSSNNAFSFKGSDSFIGPRQYGKSGSGMSPMNNSSGFGSGAKRITGPSPTTAKSNEFGHTPEPFFNKNQGTGGGAGYFGQAIYGGAAGAVFGATMADSGERGKGAIVGAMGGAMGGAAMSSMARYGTGATNRAFNAVNSKLAGRDGAIATGWKGSRGVVHKGLQGFHSKQGRNAVFASGTMLGGGAFGAMFASNGRSHKRGFNASRGNSFSR